MNRIHPVKIFVVALLAASLFLIICALIISLSTTIITLTIGISLVLSLQGIWFLMLILYAWEHPDRIKQFASPKKYEKPKHSFTALLPARYEEAVIGQTIHAIASMHYPTELMQILIICRVDDPGTIKEATHAIQQHPNLQIRLLIFDDLPINKPHALNYALPTVTNDIIVIFDAEDQPHPDLYQIVNTIYINEQPDIIQSGVQLMNYHTHWFSPLNVLEYYFWFKSVLQFFAKQGVVPLGGNTVFFRSTLLKSGNLWDEKCLTEDADIGLRLSAKGAKTRIVYDEQHATQEETPGTLSDFIKQRSRWNQGYLQILIKGEWVKLPTTRQKLLALYTLCTPIFLAMTLLYIPLALYSTIFIKMSVWLTLLALLPAYIVLTIGIVSVVGLWEFTGSYKLRRYFSVFVTLPFLIAPYQIVLGIGAIRGCFRLLTSNFGWEKTTHQNLHRKHAKGVKRG